MSYPPAAASAKTYCLIAVIMCFVAAAVWGVLSFTLAILMPVFLVLGIVAVLIAVLVYITTYDKIRIGDYVGAKGPCLVWGFLGLIIGGAIPGIFLLLAHSKLSEIAQYPPVSPAVMPSPTQYPPITVPPRAIGPTPVGGGSVVCFGCGSFMPATATSCPRCGKPR
mgnify:CR=1 FL=1